LPDCDQARGRAVDGRPGQMSSLPGRITVEVQAVIRL
jgi:hypothetical protein